jgi:hypothetical protein|tara:strand:- start:3663 stop:3872 length:210 start_codon:yes stop_codon:yes gene_type:complete
MNENVIDVGLDVDDMHYYAAALYRETGEALNFQCRPTLKGLLSHEQGEGCVCAGDGGFCVESLNEALAV